LNGWPLILKTCELISIVLSALVTGVFWGPWVGLTRSIRTFQPDFFLAIVHRLNRNLGPVMTILMPAALLSIVPVLLFSFHQPRTFCLTLAAFVLFLIALLVTVIVEVPIVQQIDKWTVSTLPGNWQQLRDRWGSFHLIRVIAAIIGLALLVAGAIF
jgi:uncharacterized membrane protein